MKLRSIAFRLRPADPRWPASGLPPRPTSVKFFDGDNKLVGFVDLHRNQGGRSLPGTHHGTSGWSQRIQSSIPRRLRTTRVYLHRRRSSPDRREAGTASWPGSARHHGGNHSNGPIPPSTGAICSSTRAIRRSFVTAAPRWSSPSTLTRASPVRAPVPAAGLWRRQGAAGREVGVSHRS